MASSWLAYLFPVLFSGTTMLHALPTSDAARAFFVFGDSLVDSGNNNYLITAARADSPPYGIDTPDHRPTGRFSNGKNLADIISEYLGSEPVLPYLSPELDGDKMLVGANFASAAAGILNDTGIELNIIHISKQLLYFAQYQRRLSSLIGAEQTTRLVNGALVLISLGSNEFANNYYLFPYSARSREFSLPDYVTYILSEYKQILTHLYDLGARRVLVPGVGPIGCLPAELALHSLDGSCDPEIQRAPELYNPWLMAMLRDLNAQLGGDVFVFVDTQRITSDFIEDPKAFGFANAKDACCGHGRFNAMAPCNLVARLCADRDAYVFWDAFHPTERANRLIVQQFMTGSVDVISPMNLSTVLAVDHIKSQQMRTT